MTKDIRQDSHSQSVGPRSGDPSALVQAVAGVVKDGLRTARFGTAKLARKLEREIANGPLPTGLPGELEVGLKSVGRVVKRSAGALSGVERTLVDSLLPGHRPQDSLNSPALLRRLTAEEAGLGVRASFFTRFIRHWVDVYLRSEGVDVHLVREIALQTAGEKFRSFVPAAEASQWAAELAVILISLGPIHGVLPGEDMDKAAAKRLDDPNTVTFLTLGLALTIAQGTSGQASPEAISEQDCLVLAKSLVAVEWERLADAAQDAGALARAFADLARIV